MNESTGFLLGYAIALAIYAVILFCHGKYKERGYLIDTKKRKAARAEAEEQLTKSLYNLFAAQSACAVGVVLIEMEENIRRSKAEQERHKREQMEWQEHLAMVEQMRTDHPT